jgi:hypothetical protein
MQLHVQNLHHQILIHVNKKMKEIDEIRKTGV